MNSREDHFLKKLDKNGIKNGQRFLPAWNQESYKNTMLADWKNNEFLNFRFIILRKKIL
jgi:hypothetical protein